jgi:hypothetical protein
MMRHEPCPLDAVAMAAPAAPPVGWICRLWEGPFRLRVPNADAVMRSASRNPLAAPSPSERRSGPPLPAQPSGRTWRQRLPARYDARTLPRLHVVRDAGKQPAQLNRGRQLTLLLECSADCSGFRFGHDEHAGSMVTRGVIGKLRGLSLTITSTPAPRQRPSSTA